MRIRTSTNTIMPALHKSAPPDVNRWTIARADHGSFLFPSFFAPAALDLNHAWLKSPRKGRPHG